MLEESESDFNLTENSNNLSEYEQRRILNLKRNHEFLKSAGLPTPKAPKFSIPKKKNHVDPRGKNESESLFKNVTLKLFGVDKNSKVSKENLPPDSELQKYIGMVKGSTAKNMINKSTTNNLKPKMVLDITFLKVLLKDAEESHNDLGKLLIQEKGNETEQDISDEEEFQALSRPRYPKRSNRKKCYKEEDVSSEDEFLQCDRCEFQYKGACPNHGPMIWVCDRKVSKKDPNRAVKTMPRFLSISNSAIPKAGLGVWTEVPLPQGFVFGPYKGKIVRKKQEAQKSGYAWQVWKGQKALHFVEGEDLSDSNWLRFVNCANQEDQQNLVAFQYKRQVFYKIYKPILPYTEILVWYGGEYASDMGIDTKEDKIITPPSVDGFKCDVCGHLFSSLYVMEQHKKRHPHMQPDRRHRCTECTYSTDRLDVLRRHLLTHTGEKPHHCNHCGKGFALKTTLQNHLRLHTGETPFLCSTCGRGFNQKAHLRSHERTHSADRPYRCQTCAKDFSQKTTLQNHELTHTQQRPHRCPHCQYRCSLLGALRKHIVSKHTKDYKHKCSFCGKGFILPSRLRKHVQKQHSTETK